MKINNKIERKMLLSLRSFLRNPEKQRITYGALAMAIVIALQPKAGVEYNPDKITKEAIDTTDTSNIEELIEVYSEDDPILKASLLERRIEKPYIGKKEIMPMPSDLEDDTTNSIVPSDPITTDEYDSDTSEVALEDNVVVEEQSEYDIPPVVVKIDIDDVYYQKMLEVGFFDLNIGEKQVYILNTYKVSYEALVDAMTNHNTNMAKEIRQRADYLEMKAFFDVLTDEKINYVLEKYSLDLEQLNVVLKTYLGECGDTYYSEGYVCCDSTLNRTKSSAWHYDIDRAFFEGAGYNIYYQITAPGQYTVYLYGGYKKFDDPRKYSTTYGVLDCLVLGINVNKYCSFRDKSNSVGEQLVKGGNKYRGVLTEDLYMENTSLKNVEPINYEVTLHLLSGDKVIGENPVLEEGMTLELKK